MKLRRSSLIAALCALGGAAAAVAQQLPADINPQSRARVPYIERKDTDESAKRLFDIFVRKKVYRRYAEMFLDREQIDEVDESRIPGYQP